MEKHAEKRDGYQSRDLKGPDSVTDELDGAAGVWREWRDVHEQAAHLLPMMDEKRWQLEEKRNMCGSE